MAGLDELPEAEGETYTISGEEDVKAIKYRGEGHTLVPDGFYTLYRINWTRIDKVNLGGLVCSGELEDFLISLSAQGTAVVQPLLVPKGGGLMECKGFMAVEARVSVSAITSCEDDPTEDFVGSGWDKVSASAGKTLGPGGLPVYTHSAVYRKVLGDWACGSLSIIRYYRYSKSSMVIRSSVDHATFNP